MPHPPRTPASDSPRWLVFLASLAFLFGAAFQLWAAYTDAPTSDEAVHLTAGVAYWLEPARRLNPEHPPLLKALAALPVLGLHPDLPTSSPAWQRGDQWSLAAEFLYQNRVSAETLLFTGRLVPVGIALLLPLLLAGLAQHLYGPQAGWWALLLVSLEPTLLGHGHLVTNDVPLAVCCSAALWVWLRLQQALATPPVEDWRPSSQRGSFSLPWRPVLLLGLSMGAALLTKYSGAVLILCLGVLTGVEVWRTLSEKGTRQQWVIAMGLAGLIALLLMSVIYRGEPVTSWLEGYAQRQAGWHQFLLGEISTHGWFSYFGIAVPLKTPPSSLLLLGWALYSLKVRPARSGEGALLLFCGLFLGVASASRIGIGVRHVLPATFVLLVLVQRGMTVLTTDRQRMLWGGLVCLSSLECLSALPYPLAYATSIIGGPQVLYRALSDSNLDWGQDVYRLRDWTRGQAPAGLLSGVFSGVPLDAAGVPLMPLPGFGGQTFREQPLPALPIQPNGALYVAMSALNLQGVYFTAEGPFKHVPGIEPGLYHFLLERPPAVRLTPSIWIWEVGRDREALLMLASICARFGWERTATLIGSHALSLKEE